MDHGSVVNVDVGVVFSHSSIVVFHAAAVHLENKIARSTPNYQLVPLLLDLPVKLKIKKE
jgi:hypothetical protein